MTPINAEIQVKNLDHLGIVAGIVDELGIVEIINELLGIQPGEIVSAGVVVKAIILNGLGFVSQPLYLFPSWCATRCALTRGCLVGSPDKLERPVARGGG